MAGVTVGDDGVALIVIAIEALLEQPVLPVTVKVYVPIALAVIEEVVPAAFPDGSVQA